MRSSCSARASTTATEMDRSVRELAALDNCLSIAAVPVGLTRHGLERQSKQVRLSRTCMRLLPASKSRSAATSRKRRGRSFDRPRHGSAHFRAERGETFLHLGDEFYLMCGEPVPPAELYDGYPQIEDGIGITRHFLENLQAYLGRAKPEAWPARRRLSPAAR